MTFKPRMVPVSEGLVSIAVGHPWLDEYREFVSARGSTDTSLATAYDLKVCFEVVGKEPCGGDGGRARVSGRAARAP
ncbi:MAG: hypothetical protein JO168_19995 [Solirubrobacterales bacterium]|nr:hypothetical protein [Solirubrobacterales bacterium]